MANQEKKRATTHRGRFGKNGTYSPKHNDRNFDTENSPHIDREKSQDNLYWYWNQKKNPGLTFDEAEKMFYEKNFSESLNAQNERHRKGGHKKRCKTMDEYRTSKQTCPEEQILQIGKKGDNIKKSDLWNICAEYINWHQKEFPKIFFLDAALHADEKGQLHFQERHVFVGKDDYGLDAAKQAKCLEQMGISRPDPSKKSGRYNNAKQTYTKICREKFIELAQAKGYEIEVEPKEKSKSGLSLLEYQTMQEKEKLKMLENQKIQLEHQTMQEEERLKKVKKELDEKYYSSAKFATEEELIELLKKEDPQKYQALKVKNMKLKTEKTKKGPDFER